MENKEFTAAKSWRAQVADLIIVTNRRLNGKTISNDVAYCSIIFLLGVLVISETMREI